MTETLATIDDLASIDVTADDAGFGALETASGVLPLKAMNVHTDITGLIYTLSLTQTFVNCHEQRLEATYVFPLPSRAAVSRFQMKVAGRVIEGVLKERQEARQEYEQAIEQGNRAALAEEDRPSVFSMKVGNIMPGEQAEVTLTLSGPLTYCDGEAEFRFPFVVAPRYIPGVPLDGESVGDGVVPDTTQVPDASRISPPVLLPGFPNPVALSFTVALTGDGLEFQGLRSSLHAVSKKEGDDGKWLISLYPGERLNRDFILRYQVAADEIQSQLLQIPDKDREEGTFQLTLVPPAKATGQVAPRQVVFVLDRSGSMGGWKMVCARRAVGRMVDTLTERDHFAVLAFDTELETPPGQRSGTLQVATDRNRFRCIEWLGNVDARYGTEMAQPLVDAVELLSADNDCEKIMVLVTDGQVGNERAILRKLGKRIEKIRIFTLGIDRSVNEGFLQRLATAGGGHCELIESEDRLDEVMDRTHRRIDTPVLTGLSLSLKGATLDEKSLCPMRFPDLFAGAPAVIRGRYKGGGKGMSVALAAKQDSQAWTAHLEVEESANKALTELWARGHIRDLEDLLVGGRGASNSEDIITKLSLRFGVLCRYTAFVAVDKSETVNADGEMVRVNQPVESPEGWELNDVTLGDDDGVLFCRAAVPVDTLGPAGGKSGVKLRKSKAARRAKRGGLVSRLLSGIMGGEGDGDELSETTQPMPSTLEEVTTRLRELIETFQSALQLGTAMLAESLYASRDDLEQIAECLGLLGGDAELVDALVTVVAALPSDAPPDSAATVAIWEKIEALVAEL